MGVVTVLYIVIGSIVLFFSLVGLGIGLSEGDDIGSTMAARLALCSFVWPVALLVYLFYLSFRKI